jgi:UDPglucose--hexose-1-phosphate uridylyltransferase
VTSFRRNPLTGEPILFAPERAARPHAFAGSFDEERCPFCSGHEADTPPELARAGEPWRVRVVPNKYPPAGGAEVIIESPDHAATFDGIEHADEIVHVYAERLRAHRDAAYVALFKNEGARAGSSIAHVHSQLIPLPFVPPRIERERAAFAGGCPLCAAPQNMIRETNAFTWFAPYASSMAYQQWIVPKRHVASLGELDDDELAELAMLLRSAAAAMREIGDSYNWIFVNTPHFYVDLFPRLTTIAGLELGTGTFVEIVDPAAAAERLRR